MRRVISAVLVLLVSMPAMAAEVTRVASSAEKNKPFGMFLDFTFNRTQETAKLTREWYQDGSNVDVTELNYEHVATELGIGAHIGIFRDLELHFDAPIVFQDDRTWSFAKGTTEDNTTIYRNCVNAQGVSCSTPGRGTDRLFTVGPNSASYRSGLGNLTFGIAYAIMNNKKDDTKPTWVIRFDYTAPTSATLNPAMPTSTGARGNIGDRVHKYTFSTALSKRIGPADPYFDIHYTLPWKGPLYYSNCQDASTDRMAKAENCDTPDWSRLETGIRPAHTGGILFGSEFNLYEREEHHQRVVLDLRGFMNYVSEGRTYNELSDMMGKLLYTSDYGQIGGQLTLLGQAAEFVQLKVTGQFAYYTEHFLTNESIGRDLNGNKTIDVTASPIEISPNYDFRVDRVGRRFRVQEQLVFNILATATFAF